VLLHKTPREIKNRILLLDGTWLLAIITTKKLHWHGGIEAQFSNIQQGKYCQSSMQHEVSSWGLGRRRSYKFSTNSVRLEDWKLRSQKPSLDIVFLFLISLPLEERN
jgi:hypothetical protein